MFGWRGKIGLVIPGDWHLSHEYDPILPEGVIMDIYTCGLERMVPEEFERIFNMYPQATRHLARQECSVVVIAGSPLLTYVGYDRTQEMVNGLRKELGIPITTDLDAHFDALRALSAKKIVMASPYEEARNQERKKLFEQHGFEILKVRGLGIQRRVELGKQPAYASYLLAKQVYFEAPEADAIYISCPEWATVRNIQRLEYDTGKPVVAHVTGIIWGALRAINIREPIKGWGRLLEST